MKLQPSNHLSSKDNDICILTHGVCCTLKDLISTSKNSSHSLIDIKAKIISLNSNSKDLLELMRGSNFCKSSCLQKFVKKVSLRILQNSQENTCARVCFLIKFTKNSDSGTSAY